MLRKYAEVIASEQWGHFLARPMSINGWIVSWQGYGGDHGWTRNGVIYFGEQ